MPEPALRMQRQRTQKQDPLLQSPAVVMARVAGLIPQPHFGAVELRGVGRDLGPGRVGRRAPGQPAGDTLLPLPACPPSHPRNVAQPLCPETGKITGSWQRVNYSSRESLKMHEPSVADREAVMQLRGSLGIGATERLLPCAFQGSGRSWTRPPPLKKPSFWWERQTDPDMSGGNVGRSGLWEEREHLGPAWCGKRRVREHPQKRGQDSEGRLSGWGGDHAG